MTDDWKMKECVGRLKLLSKTMTGEEIAQQIVVILFTELGIAPHAIVVSMQDGAAVNDLAMRTIRVIYNQLLDIGCFSHTLNLVGERMNTPILLEFTKVWIGLFSRSPKMRLLWRNQTGMNVPLYSATRWWSRYEVIDQLLVAFGDVETFLSTNDDLSPATSAKLKEIMSDPAKARKLKIEIAITVDVMGPFVQATCKLEGDGPLSLSTYEALCIDYNSALSKRHCCSQGNSLWQSDT